MSPLFFCLFINSLGEQLNSTGLGIDLASVNVSALFFADDIALVGKTKEALDTLMTIARKYFLLHRLELSSSKTKIMSYDAATGKTKFPGFAQVPPITLEQVVNFKYLGVTLSS